MSLDDIKFVLVRPTHPGNIGATARAMTTMGLPNLSLVAPRDHPSEVATARAAGADRVLDNANVVASLEQAIADCGLVVATTARERTTKWPTHYPREGMTKVFHHSSRCKVAVVFGQERSGLSNEELDLCQFMVKIPANPEYSSLNVASAVQIVAYELRLAHLASADSTAENSIEKTNYVNVSPPSGDQIRRFYQHLEEVIFDINFVKTDNSTKLMRKLIRLFNRAQMTQEELNILRGILTAVQWHVPKDKARPK